MKTSNTKVSGKAATLIIAGSALLPVALFSLYLHFGPGTLPGGAPTVTNLGGFDQFGMLQGLTLQVGSRTYVCGGPEGHVVCMPSNEAKSPRAGQASSEKKEP